MIALRRAALVIALIIGLIIALAGCSSVLGFKDVTVGDAGTDGIPDDATLVAPPNTVVGRSYAKCHQATGDVASPTDLSQSIIQALIFDDSAQAYRTVEGASKVDGTFRIDGVPDGVTYMLRLGTVYYVTDQHVIDLSFETARRCIPAPAMQTLPTSITWNLGGMTPFHLGVKSADDIEVASLALGLHRPVFNVFSFGDTTFDTVLDWTTEGFDLASTPLVDATTGDDLFIFHSRRETLPSSIGRRHSALRLVDWARPTGITVRDGVSTSITGVFQPIVANKTISFFIDRGLFDAGRGGASQPSGFSVSINATPAPDDGLGGQRVAYFDLDDISRSGSLQQTVTNYRYGDPFPDSWRRYYVIESGFRRYYKLTGTSFGASTFVSSRQVAEFTTTIDVRQQLQPPSGARIGGAAFELGGKVVFDGTSPVEVAWNPVLSARSYRLSVSRVTASGRQLVAIIRTTSTSIKIPAELFAAGQFYVFVLGAVRAPNDYQGGQLIPTGLPFQIAELPSGMFRLGSECGDGVAKAGEESCDARGETAACDVDCTLPECGDGLRNAAAGEACDAGGFDAPGCNANCTLPVCGDGHLNNTVEDCDDGNTVEDGNGCGTDCKFNSFCGNGRVESLVEECEPGSGGETATCDSDCTRVRCGDEHVNAAAGEECDDGFGNGGGRCSSGCKLNP
jgi:cysteine-rich repeat protein